MSDSPQPIPLSELIAQGKVIEPPKPLTQQDKEQLAANGTPFTVNSIQYGDDNEFGPYWQFEIDLNGKTCQFRLSSNEKRDTFVSALATVTTEQPVSGVRLRAASTRGGNSFLVVEPAS